MFQRLIALLIVIVFATPAAAYELSPSDSKLAAQAFKALDKAKPKNALKTVAKIKDPLTAKIVRWKAYTKGGSGADFATLRTFLDDNPDWPGTRALKRRAEEAMAKAKLPPEDVLKWRDTHGISSTDGWIRVIEALFALKRTKEAKLLVREVWVERNFSKAQEKSFYRRYRKHLTAGDHIVRLDRLIWEERTWPAKRMLWRVNKRIRALAVARISLMRMEGNVDTLIANVAPDLKSHPGLVFERIRWRRKKGKDLAARDLLKDFPIDQQVRPDKWWKERAGLARLAVKKGHITEAYKLVADHGLDPGADLAEAEFLSGWIQLRFMDDPRTALKHFERLYDNVKYPVSRARGAYWAGRAAEALDNPKLARDWYLKAARHHTVYYGQLARERVEPGAALPLAEAPLPLAGEIETFNADEMTQVVRHLGRLQRQADMKAFLSVLAERHDTPGWRALTAALSRELGRPDLTIHIAKRAARDGIELGPAGYPTFTPPKLQAKRAQAIDKALLFSLIRQESAFYTAAKSHVGARGLMQVMPATAKRVAKSIRLRYSRAKLLTDPAYNLTIGQSYMAGLLEDFAGSYVLSLAAYNAGPGRANRWIKDYGDPRSPETDAIDWVEHIPFSETRNYVQRVMENLQVYRRQIADSDIASRLGEDLAHSTPNEP